MMESHLGNPEEIIYKAFWLVLLLEGGLIFCLVLGLEGIGGVQILEVLGVGLCIFQCFFLYFVGRKFLQNNFRF